MDNFKEEWVGKHVERTVIDSTPKNKENSKGKLREWDFRLLGKAVSNATAFVTRSSCSFQITGARCAAVFPLPRHLTIITIAFSDKRVD